MSAACIEIDGNLTGAPTGGPVLVSCVPVRVMCVRFLRGLMVTSS